MIEILNCREINKGCLLSKINIKIKKWGLVLNKIGVFSKNGKRWISLPNETYEENGEKKYFPLIKFDDKEAMNRFQNSVLEEFDKINKNNHPKETENEELPF